MNPGNGDPAKEARERADATCPYMGRPCPQDAGQCRKWITLDVPVQQGPGNLSLPRPQIQRVQICEDDFVVQLLQSINMNQMQLAGLVAQGLGAKVKLQGIPGFTQAK